jgi:hypothetical protein
MGLDDILKIEDSPFDESMYLLGRYAIQIQKNQSEIFSEFLIDLVTTR